MNVDAIATGTLGHHLFDPFGGLLVGEPFRLGRAPRDTSAPAAVYRRRDGSAHDVAIRPSSVDAEQRHKEARRRRHADRAARLFAGMTDAIAAARDAHELLTEACRVVADVCVLDLAWVGFACPTGRIRPAARVGIAQGTLDAMRMTTDDGPAGESPTSRAVRKGRPVIHLDVLEDVLADERQGGWQETAWAQSIRSVAAIPLRLEGKVVGAWTLCSSQSYFFDAQEIALLVRTAECLSTTLERLARAERATRAA
jgi:transcriptional regulator with GAF, ATPase, and Fis domain